MSLDFLDEADMGLMDMPNGWNQVSANTGMSLVDEVVSWDSMNVPHLESSAILEDMDQQSNASTYETTISARRTTRHEGLHTADCMQRACATLESLHTPVEDCSRAPLEPAHNTNSRDLDAILETNRKAINNVSQTLSCVCARDMKVSHLLILIANLVLDSYTSLSKLHLLDTADLAKNDDASHMRMAIGGYILKGTTRTKVIKQLFKSEIEDVACLIENMVSQHTAGSSEDQEVDARKVFIDSLQVRLQQLMQSMT